MWRDVDFAERGAFETVFNGAVVDAAANGRVVLRDAPYRFIEIADSRVQALGLPDGRTRRMHWRKVGALHLVDRIRQGHEEFRVRYRKSAPVRIEIHHRFGPEWGLEILQLTDR